MKRKYYEVEFAHKNEIENKNFEGIPDVSSICIVGERKPSREEAEIFAKEDMKLLGYDMVNDVLDISSEEAHKFFDFETRDEDDLPIFR